MSALVRFYSAKEAHTFWTLSISLSTTCKEVCGTIAAKLDNGSQFVMYQEHAGTQQKLLDQAKPLEIKAGWGKNADDYKFVLKDETKTQKLLRVYSEDNENTFWTIPIKPDTTAKHVTETIANKLDTPHISYILFETGTGMGEIAPTHCIYNILEKNDHQAKFKVKKDHSPLSTSPKTPSSPTATTPGPTHGTTNGPTNGPNHSTPNLSSTHPPTTPVLPPAPIKQDTQPKQDKPDKNEHVKQDKTQPTTTPAPQPTDTTPYTPSTLPPLPPVLVTPPDPSTAPPLQRPPPLDYMVPLMVTDQVLKLVSFAFGKLASPEESTQYRTDYDKLVYLATYPNDSVQENALRLITNITTDSTNQGLIAQTPLLPIIVHIGRFATGSGKTQMLAAWVLSNLAVNQETLPFLNKHGAAMALMEMLATNGLGDETREQALRALTNLGKSDECKQQMISSGFAVIATRTLNSAFEDIANLALRVLVNLGLTSEIRDAVVAAGGLPHILHLIGSEKEQTIKMASFVLANMCVDGKLNSLIATLGGIPPIVHLLKTSIPFVQEQAVTLVANLALLERNLEVLHVEGVIALLIALFRSISKILK